MGIIRNIKTKQQKDNTKYNVTVTVGDDSGGNVKTVKVSIAASPSKPTPSPKNLSLTFSTTIKGGRIFINVNTLMFSANAVGYTYDMTAIMLDVNGRQIGNKCTEPVLIEAYSVEGEGEGA